MNKIEEFVNKGLIVKLTGIKDLIISYKNDPSDDVAITNINPRLWIIHREAKLFVALRFYGGMDIHRAKFCFDFYGEPGYSPDKNEYFSHLKMKTHISDWDIYQSTPLSKTGIYMDKFLKENGYSEIIYSPSSPLGRIKGIKQCTERILKVTYVPEDFTLALSWRDIDKLNQIIAAMTQVLRRPLLRYQGREKELNQLCDKLRSASASEIIIEEISENSADFDLKNINSSIRKFNTKQRDKYLANFKPAKPVVKNAWSAGAFNDLLSSRNSSRV